MKNVHYVLESITRLSLQLMVSWIEGRYASITYHINSHWNIEYSGTSWKCTFVNGPVKSGEGHVLEIIVKTHGMTHGYLFLFV